MKVASVIKKVFADSALVGAALTVLCGLLLLTRLGEAWKNASYDSLYRFGSRAATNPIVLIRMDHDSYTILGQNRGTNWDRNLHAELLTNLTAGGARLVVFDIFFQDTNDPAADLKLAEAMRQNGHVVLTAFVNDSSGPQFDRVSVEAPHKLFAAAAAGWGVGQCDAATGQLARRHWLFYMPGEGDIHSLGWAAARVFGKKLDARVEHQWLRYYGQHGPGTNLPYHQALTQNPEFFHDKIVFIGNWPEKPRNQGFPEPDKFLTPYTSQTEMSVGGMEIMATTFLNLVNDDWLRRLPSWMEVLLLTLTGALIGGGLGRLEPLPSLLVAVGISLAVLVAAVLWNFFENHWFPWLVIAGGQVPCALAWAWVSRRRQVTIFHERFPGYAPVGEKPFGEGAFGKVWLVRNAIGHLQALKEINRSNPNFDGAGPYEREFSGIKSYLPVSSEHPGLLHIGHVNCNEQDGYFYYVMELGDALDPDWERKGGNYQPRDLTHVCRLATGGRLSVGECFRISIVLLEALHFLHQRGLVHRDIKPSNIIFVNDRPKLADVGLVRKIIEGTGGDATIIGTKYYMPPPPEPLGTKVADIYALGKVLYVISTGKPVETYSEFSTTRVETSEFMQLNAIICQACERAADQRYPSAAAMLAALRKAQSDLDDGHTRRV